MRTTYVVRIRLAVTAGGRLYGELSMRGHTDFASYLVAGKPIFSCEPTGPDALRNGVHVVRTIKESAVHVEHVLSNDIPELRRRRREIARADSWQARAGRIRAILGEACSVSRTSS